MEVFTMLCYIIYCTGQLDLKKTRLHFLESFGQSFWIQQLLTILLAILNWLCPTCMLCVTVPLNSSENRYKTLPPGEL